MSNYNPTTWVNGESPAINADNLNHIETGISDNSTSIAALSSDMAFKGIADNLSHPLPDNPKIGDTYQAADDNIINHNITGDLIVCDGVSPVSWHVIPCGSRGNGTVTSVQAGDGISIQNGAITGAGTISVNTTYTAVASNAGGSGGRNGFMKAIQAYKVDNLANIALSGSYNDLTNFPEELSTIVANGIQQTTGSSIDDVMSQNAITEALDTKTDIGHTHAISDVTNLSSLLATDRSSNFTKASSDTHNHGIISRDGYLLDSEGYVQLGVQFLRTTADGKISSTVTVPSSSIDGVTFSNGSINISTMKNDIDIIKNILTPDYVYPDPMPDIGDLMEHAATEDHTHLVFSSENIGFVPMAPVNNASEKLLTGAGTWADAVDLTIPTHIIDIMYPIGSYYETSNNLFDPNANTSVNAKWAGIWVLENEGFVHVSASQPNEDARFLVAGANESNGTGVKDGGEESVTLTAEEAAQKAITIGSGGAHSHINYRKSFKESGDKSTRYGADVDATPTEANEWTGTKVSGEHTHDITGSDAEYAHNNMQPYINIYRWHRIG